MKRQDLQAEYDRFKFQIQSIKENVGKSPDELVALSSQQVCVSICGSLEQCLKGIFVEYAKQRSGIEIHRPIEKVCESYQNPKTNKILELVNLFDDDFGRQLEALWKSDNEIEKAHLDNLVDDRITIAHRKRTHISVSTGKLSNYLTAYSELLNRLFEHFLGNDR